MATISNTNYFSPTQISGCSLWLDAADENSVSRTGVNVTAWNDKSGNNILLNGASGATYIRNFNGSYNAIILSGGTGISVGSNNTFSLSNPATIFSVFQNTNTNTGNNPYLFNTGGNSGTRAYAYILSGTSLTNLRISAGGANSDSITNVNPANFQVFNMNMGSSATTTFTNGIQIGSNVIPGGTTTGICIAGNTAQGGSPNGWVGALCEFIIFNTALTTTQRQQVEGYLAWKWGTQANLPTNHPYFYNPMIPNLILSAPLANPLTTTNTTLVTLNPTQIAGCALWLDAADSASVIRTGVNVTAWNDKSGNNNNATTAGSPTYISSSLNRLNGVQISGVSQSWTTPSFVLSPTSRLSAFVVAKGGTRDAAFNINLLIAGGSYQNLSVYLRYSQPTAEYAAYVGGAGAFVNTSFTNTINVPNIYELVYDSSTGSPYVNGTPYSTFAAPISGTSLTTAQNLSASNNGANTFTQYEVLFFNVALTTTQRQQIEGYLAWKWGLQANLPTTHPYYYNPLIPNLILPSQVYSLAPSFSPVRFSGLGLWLDAADSASVVTSGSSVTQWNDKSTGNNSSTGVTGTVTYNSNLLNFGGGAGSSYVSIPSIAFSTTNMTFFIYLKFTSTFIYPTDANYYYVDFFNAIGATQMIYGMVRFNSSPYNWVINNYTAGGATNGQGSFYTGVGGPTGTSYIITIVTNGSTYTQYLNGNLINTTTSTSFVPTTPASFRIGTGANGMNIGEIAFFQNTTMTTNQRQQIEGYLAWKWGLQTSLPANHPYFLYPPS